MPLITQIHDAVKNGHLPRTFTVENLKLWIREHEIVKDDGGRYADASIDAILSNSNEKNIPTSNKNIKILQSRINSRGKHEYCF